MSLKPMKPIVDRIMAFITRHELGSLATLSELLGVAVRVSTHDDEDLQAKEIHSVVKGFITNRISAEMLRETDPKILNLLQKICKELTQ